MQNSKRKFQRIIFIILFSTAITLTSVSVYARPIPVANHSFETPTVEPGEFALVTVVPYWIEQDLDTDPEFFGRNTGIFLNTAPGSNDYIVNADGDQLAFLGGMQGNALLQDLTATYQIGRKYRLTLGVCVSISPYAPKPVDPLIVAIYYVDQGIRTDIKTLAIDPTPLTATELVNFSITLPPVQPSDVWAGKHIGIAIRGSGMAGGFWDLDNVRLTELAGDMTGDGVVNLADFAIFAEYWLDSL
jgi:hypothetical protein